MGTLRYAINVTLDGCVSHDAVVPTRALHDHCADGIRQADTLLYGRIVYGMMEAAWRPVAETGIRPDWMDDWMVPFAETIHHARKIVVSDTLAAADWSADLIRGDDLAARVGRLKRQTPGRILTGGVTLPSALVRAGLVDEIELVIHPRLAGRGPTFLAGLPAPLDLEPISQVAMGDGIHAHIYAIAHERA